MVILEVTPVAFGDRHRGGGESYPLRIINELAKTQVVVACYGYDSQGMDTRATEWRLPARFLDIPGVVSRATPLPDFRTVASFRAILRNYRDSIEVIHIHNYRTPLASLATILSGLRSLERANNWRVVLTDHGAAGFPYVRLLCRFADGYAPVSRLSDRILQGYRRLPSEVVPPAVSPDLFEQALRKPFVERNIDLLFFGRQTRGKRPHLLILLVEELLKAGKEDLHVMIAGPELDLEYSTYMRRLVARKGLEDHIQILGAQSEAEKRSLFSRSKLHCLFSATPVTLAFGRLRYNELAPATVAEAAACGLPSVVSPFPGADEQVIDGVTGIIVDVTDSETLTTSVLGILSDSGIWSRYSRQAIEWVETHRSLPRTTAKLLRFFDSLQ